MSFHTLSFRRFSLAAVAAWLLPVAGLSPVLEESPGGSSISAVAVGQETVARNPAAGDADNVRTQPLYPGDAAPGMQIANWVRGNPVKEFRSGTVYVVEFWATWCGPCRTSMPHLSALQAQYGNKVQVIGVTDEDPETIQEFLKETGPKDKTWAEIVNYTLAVDDGAQTTTSYMVAADQSGIPTAFIVGRSGKVEWFGHPMTMDSPLQEIVGGTWDLAKARENHITAIKEEEALNKALPALQEAMASENFTEAAKIMRGLLKEFPSSERFQMVTLQILLQGKLRDEVLQHGAGLLKAFDTKPETLDQIAWMLATIDKDRPAAELELAQKAAQRAVEVSAGKNSSALDTLARIHFEKGDIAQAILWQKKAVAVDPGDPQLAATLKGYEAAQGAKDENGKKKSTQP